MKRHAGISVYLLRQGAGPLAPRALTLVAGSLGRSDRRRFRAMASRKRRTEFAAGRLLLRYALRHRYGGASDGWRVEASGDRAPRLETGGADDCRAVISISHSAGLVACAIAELPRLGIDIEQYRSRKRDVSAIAEVVLHRRELAELARLPPAARRHYFYRHWTLKEALAKALGVGLALPFQDFAFCGDRLVASPRNWGAKREPWGFASVDVAVGVALGLAWTTERRSAGVTVSVRDVAPLELPFADPGAAAESAGT